MTEEGLCDVGNFKREENLLLAVNSENRVK